jgi:two-component system, sensor histidine kinase and response regulator
MDVFGLGLEITQGKSRDVDAIQGILGAQVLLAEDNKINQQVATELLEANGMMVTVANNGIEAVNKVQEKQFDVVLMDIQMPQMDGFAATNKIRSLPDCKKLPILAMTAHAMAGDREKSLNAGMNDHITKPIDPDKLFDALVKWIPAKERNVVIKSQPSSDKNTEFTLPENLPGIDLKVGLKHISGNSKLLGKLLKEFHKDYRNVIAEIRSNIEEDQPTAQRTVHTLKGVAGSIGAAALQSSALTLEQALGEARSEEYEKLIADLEQNLKPVLQGIATLDLSKDSSQTATREAAHISEPTPVNIESLTPALKDLHKLLKSGHSRSQEKLTEVCRLLANNATDKTSRINELIEDYEYEEAVETLLEIAKMLNVQLDS